MQTFVERQSMTEDINLIVDNRFWVDIVVYANPEGSLIQIVLLSLRGSDAR